MFTIISWIFPFFFAYHMSIKKPVKHLWWKNSWLGVVVNYVSNYDQIKFFDWESFAEGWLGCKHLINNLAHAVNLSLITSEKQDLQ